MRSTERRLKALETRRDDAERMPTEWRNITIEADTSPDEAKRIIERERAATPRGVGLIVRELVSPPPVQAEPEPVEG